MSRFNERNKELTIKAYGLNPWTLGDCWICCDEEDRPHTFVFPCYRFLMVEAYAGDPAEPYGFTERPGKRALSTWT